MAPGRKIQKPGAWRCKICSAWGRDPDPLAAWTAHYMSEHHRA